MDRVVKPALPPLAAELKFHIVWKFGSDIKKSTGSKV